MSVRWLTASATKSPKLIYSLASLVRITSLDWGKRPDNRKIFLSTTANSITSNIFEVIIFNGLFKLLLNPK